MAISDKLEYLNDTKQLLKDKINNLGGSITDETTFREYVEELQDIYDVLPKTEFQEGTEVTIENGLKGKLDFENDIVGYGQTSQEGTPTPDNPQEIEVVRGKNRLNNTLTNKTQQGIEFIVNEDKTIKANGTATGTSGIVIGQVQLTANETYTLSGCASNGGSGKYTLSVSPNGETTRLVDDTGSGATYTPTTSGIYDIRLNYWYGFNIQNLTFKPMLEKGSQATSYLPYNTIEIVESGINLANVSLPYDTNASGETSKWGSASTIPNFKVGEKYYLYGKCSDGTYLTGSNSALVIMRSGSQILNKPFQQSFTCNIDISQATGWYIWTNSSLAGKTITEIGIYEGNSNKPYEPYSTPRTYQFSLGNNKFYNIGTYRDYILRTTGKNLCNGVNQDYWINSAGTQAGKTTGNSGLAIPIKENTTYTISTIATQERYRAGFVSSLPVDNTGVTIYSGQNKDNTNNSVTITNTSYQYLIVNATDLTKIQIEEGSTASDYQPYGVGNWYKVGKIEEVVYDGSSDENWSVSGLSVTGYKGYYIDNYTKPQVSDSPVKSNYFIQRPYTDWSGLVTANFIETSTSTIGIRIEETLASNLTNFKTWLATHNVKAIYPLATPTYTQITGDLATQLEAFWNGLSNNGTTILESNGDLPMIIKVRALKGE